MLKSQAGMDIRRMLTEQQRLAGSHMSLKAEEIRGLNADELTARIAELEEERFRLKFRSGTEALDEPLRLRSIRRDIARLKTVQRERQLATRGR